MCTYLMMSEENTLRVGCVMNRRTQNSDHDDMIPIVRHPTQEPTQSTTRNIWCQEYYGAEDKYTKQ
jgi:hypothetical protein